MPKPSSKRAIAAMTGHEPGSVYSMLSPAARREFAAWLRKIRLDNSVREAQLADRPFVRPRHLSEV